MQTCLQLSNECKQFRKTKSEQTAVQVEETERGMFERWVTTFMFSRANHKQHIKTTKKGNPTRIALICLIKYNYQFFSAIGVTET